MNQQIAKQNSDAHAARILPRRVLFLALQLNGGGVTTHMMTLAQGLMKQGVEVWLGTRGQTGEHAYGPAWFEAHNIPCRSIPFPIFGSPVTALGDAFRAMQALVRVVRTFKPDVIHLHSRSVSPYAQLLWWYYKIPFVATLHSLSLPASLPYRFVSFWGRRTICVSREVQNFLMHAFGVSEQQIALIPHGVDPDHFHPPTAPEREEARRQLGLQPTEFTVALIANWSLRSGLSRKGHDVFMHALKRVQAQGKQVVALLAGTGPPEPLMSMARTYEVQDQVRLCGHRAARDILWTADLLILPSEDEAFGLVVIEAMLCGVPVLRTTTGGSTEQIKGAFNGVLVPPRDPQALALQLCRLHGDAELRTRLAEAARRFALAQFTQQRMVQDVLEVYAEVLEKRTALSSKR